jgi:hypothetical protein
VERTPVTVAALSSSAASVRFPAPYMLQGSGATSVFMDTLVAPEPCSMHTCVPASDQGINVLDPRVQRL